MRVLHSSDWHLGHCLAGTQREEEHALFLDFLLNLIRDMKIDVLTVGGDIFDTIQPTASSLKNFFSFVSSIASLGCKGIFICGNHDSVAYFSAFSVILRNLHIYMVGQIPQDDRIDDIILEFEKDGEKVIFAPIPFIRPYDLPAGGSLESYEETISRYIRGISDCCKKILDRARKRRTEEMGFIVLGHMFIAGGDTCPESERPIQIEAGKVIGIPPSIFGDDITAVLLGHLHRCQTIHNSVPIFYSGAPIPLSFDEASYPHKLLFLELKHGGNISEFREIDVPMFRKIAVVKGETQQILERLHEIGDEKNDLPTFIRIIQEDKNADRSLFYEAIKDKNARILEIRVMRPEQQGLSENIHPMMIKPEEMLCKYAQQIGQDIDDEIRQAFHEILNLVEDEMRSVG